MDDQYAFISHSSEDKPFVQRLAQELKTEGVWVDMWDMDLGDALVHKIELGINRASEFIVILSEAALKSHWVQYELHMGIIRSLEDDGFRIVAVRIDKCEIPLRFKPFLSVDSPDDSEASIAQVKAFLRKRRASGDDTGALLRRQFVNRTSELGQIEQYVADPEVRVICLNGFFGIGKTTLVREAAKRLWQRPQLAMFSLTPAHVGPRLSLELAAAALALPPDGASQEDLLPRPP